MRNGEEKHIIVGKCFIRVVKNHDIFLHFRNSFYNFIKSELCNGIARGERNLRKVFGVLNQVANNDFQHHRRGNDKYEEITFIINTFIRYFLDGGNKIPKGFELGMLGQEIFDLACYKIYGDQYLSDMEEMQKNAPKPETNFDLFLNTMYQLHSRNNKNMSFDEFIERYGEDCKAQFKKIMENGWG